MVNCPVTLFNMRWRKFAQFCRRYTILKSCIGNIRKTERNNFRANNTYVKCVRNLASTYIYISMWSWITNCLVLLVNKRRRQVAVSNHETTESHIHQRPSALDSRHARHCKIGRTLGRDSSQNNDHSATVPGCRVKVVCQQTVNEHRNQTPKSTTEQSSRHFRIILILCI